MDDNLIPLEPFPASTTPVPPNPGLPPQKHVSHPARRIAILSTVLLVVFIGLFIWAFVQYRSYKNDIQPKIDVAVEQAVKDNTAELESDFQLERERLVLPFQTNSGITNVSFMYPRDWSQHLLEDEKDRVQIEAVFHPTVVQEGKIYALRLQIIQRAYDDVVNDYETEIEKEGLKAQPITNSNTLGVRLDGPYEKDRNGALVIFPIRDKTLVLITESNEYLRVFNEVLDSLSFTP